MQPKPFFAALLAMLVFMPAALSAACDLNSAGNTVFSSNITCEGGMGNTTGNITINDGVYVEFRGATLNLTGLNPTVTVNGALIVNRSSLIHRNSTDLTEGLTVNTDGADAPLQIIKSKFGATKNILIRPANSVINGLVLNGTRWTGAYYYSIRTPIFVKSAKWTVINNVSIYDARNYVPIVVNSSTGTRVSNVFLDGSATLGYNYVYILDSNHTQLVNVTSYNGGSLYFGSYSGVTGATIKNFTAKNLRFLNTSQFLAPVQIQSGTNMHFKNITFANIYARRNLSNTFNSRAILFETRSIKDCKIVNSSFTDYRYNTYMPFETKVSSTTYSNATTYCSFKNVTFVNSTSGMMNKPYYTSSVTREQLYWYYQPLVRGSASGGRQLILGANISIASKRLALNVSILTQADGVPLASADNLLYSAKVNASTVTRYRYNISISKDGHTNSSVNALINNSNWNQNILLLGLDEINIIPNFANRTAVTKHAVWRVNATVTSLASALDNETVYARIGSGSWIKLRNTSSGNPSWFFAPVNITQQGGQYYFITVNASDTLGNISVIDGNAIFVNLPARYAIGFMNKTAVRKYRNWELNVSVVAPYLSNESVYARFGSGSWIKLQNSGSPNASFFFKGMNMTLQMGQYHYVTFNMTDTFGDTLVQDGYAVWVYDECTINATATAYMRFSGVCSGAYNVIGNLIIEDGANVEFRGATLNMTANNQIVSIRGSVVFNRSTVKKASASETQYWDLYERKSADFPIRIYNSYFNSLRYFYPSKNRTVINGLHLNNSVYYGIYVNSSSHGSYHNITAIGSSATGVGGISADGLVGTLTNTTFDGIYVNKGSIRPSAIGYAVIQSAPIKKLDIRNINVMNVAHVVYLYGGYPSVIIRNMTIENVTGTVQGYYSGGIKRTAIPLFYYIDNSGTDVSPLKNILLRNWELRLNITNASMNNNTWMGTDFGGFVYGAGVRNFTIEDMKLYDFKLNSSTGMKMPFVLLTTRTLADTDEIAVKNVTVYNTSTGAAIDLPYFPYDSATYLSQQRFASYWYFAPNITYSNGTAVEGANITLSSKRFGDKSFLTQANGVPYGTSDSLFLGVRVNGTVITGYRYNVTVEKEGCFANSSDNMLLNNSNWGALGFTLQEIPPKRLIAVMSTPSGNITSLSVNFNYAARTDAGNAHVAYCNLTKNGTVVRRDFSVANGSAENITYGFGAGDNYRCFVMRVSCTTNETSPTSNSSGGAVICLAQYGLPENNWNMPSLLSLILALGIAAVALFTAFSSDMGDKEVMARAAIGILFLIFALAIVFGA